MVPLLKRYSPSIASYMGIDISSENLSEAQRIILLGNGRMPEFPCELIQGDVTRLSSLTLSQFDIVVYLSALEHLNREDGLRSLGEVSRALAENGRLYLSTPNTPEENSRKLQHRVHIYEWSFKDIRSVLEDLKMTITNSIGLLPPPEELLLHLIDEKYGVGGVRWFEDMQACVPEAFLAPVVAASFPEFANEILFICQKKRG
jgi:ubiquinone/menaquinone biosynthesis C-methylase UbiE